MLPLMIHHKGRGQPHSLSGYDWIDVIDNLLTFVPPVNIPPRAPFGPSVVLNAGTPLDGMDLDLQKSAATRSETLPASAHKQ